ncbi:tetratricopeptide repeat protein [Vampirovibrio sp.]|uniref:tetratricopeptide repeat protein n=1 Tax=Vampirovibrio sp. TaxID=2717857 RepID=UPI0035947FB1
MRIAFHYHRLLVSLLGGLLVGLLWLPVTASAQTSSNPEAIQNYNQGIEAYNQGRTNDALNKFIRATQVDSAYGDAYYNLGSMYYQLKRYPDAADMFQKSVNLTPNDHHAKYNLALSLEKLNRNEEAINILSLIPASDPQYPQAKAKLNELRPALKPQSATTTTAPATVNKPAAAATTTAKPAAATTAAPGKLGVKVFSKGYDGPTGITIGPGGFMYVANYSKNLIYRVGANGEKTVFSSGEGIKGPIGLTYNPKTNELYVANYLLNNVARINAAGKASTLIGSLNKPYNLFMDTVNNALFVSEQDPANVISRISLP